MFIMTTAVEETHAANNVARALDVLETTECVIDADRTLWDTRLPLSVGQHFICLQVLLSTYVGSLTSTTYMADCHKRQSNQLSQNTKRRAKLGSI